MVDFLSIILSTSSRSRGPVVGVGLEALLWQNQLLLPGCVWQNKGGSASWSDRVRFKQQTRSVVGYLVGCHQWEGDVYQAFLLKEVTCL